MVGERRLYRLAVGYYQPVKLKEYPSQFRWTVHRLADQFGIGLRSGYMRTTAREPVSYFVASRGKGEAFLK